MAAAPEPARRPEREPAEEQSTAASLYGPSPESQLATSAMAYLLAGPLGFGAIGFGLDRLLGTWIFVVLGILGGMALSIYVLWLRYGTP